MIEMTDTTTQDREAFEAWLSSGAGALKKLTLKQVFERDKNGQYVDQLIECCWVGWQGASAYKDKQMQERMDTMQARLNWLTNEVLYCDFGDNQEPCQKIGWGIRTKRRDGEPFIFGPSVDEAIDQARGKA